MYCPTALAYWNICREALCANACLIWVCVAENGGGETDDGFTTVTKKSSRRNKSELKSKRRLDVSSENHKSKSPYGVKTRGTMVISQKPIKNVSGNTSRHGAHHGGFTGRTEGVDRVHKTATDAPTTARGLQQGIHNRT